MQRRSIAAVFVLTGVCAVLMATLGSGRDPVATPVAVREPRILPGLLSNGFVQLPNQWKLRPAGIQLEVGDFPVNIALHPGGQFLAVLHAGYRDHEILTVSIGGARPKLVSRVIVDQAFVGLCFAPDGKHLYASGGEYEVVHTYDFAGGYLSNPQQISVAAPGKFVVAGIALSPDGSTIYAPGVLGNAVNIVSVAEPTRRTTVSLEALGKTIAVATTGPSFRENETERASLSPDACYPYSCLAEPNGKRLFVSLWNKAAIAVIDLSTKTIAGTWPTERHPTEMALSPDGKTLYVACSNSTRVSVVDTETGKGLQTIECALFPGAPNGSTPNSLCLTPDGDLLFVANADNNTVAVFNVAERGEAKPQGFIPVGWYPTSVRYHAGSKKLYVANGKGVMPKANPHGPQPTSGRSASTEYVAGLLSGTIAAIDLPTPAQMARYSKTAYQCSPLKADAGVVGDVPVNNPVPAKIGDGSPIKHVIYIVKENRTYDQVFGDIEKGNGSPELCLFPEQVTPNHHKLAREYVLLDNTYVDGEVSADGHEWSMGAYATDFVEKTWPLNYRQPNQRKLTYPAEGAVESLARPAGGYIWDRCAEAGVTYRSYGEWVHNGRNPGDPGVAAVKALEGHFDPQFRSFDLEYTDVKRAARFAEEMARFEKENAMPQFIVLRLPNDHTAGARANRPTPVAMVADNDVALGRIVETVSKSRFWRETAIFVIEDDAQNGPDHVDAHRTVALVVSPYTKRGYVDSTMYSTSSLLRTMELILGLKPMSQYDAAARPMYNAFQPNADDRPYTALEARVDLGAKNSALAWGADLSEKFDLTKEDLVDDLLFNEVIWRSVRGPGSSMPPPVRAAFVFPHIKADADDDDDDD